MNDLEIFVPYHNNLLLTVPAEVHRGRDNFQRFINRCAHPIQLIITSRSASPPLPVTAEAYGDRDNLKPSKVIRTSKTTSCYQPICYSLYMFINCIKDNN